MLSNCGDGSESWDCTACLISIMLITCIAAHEFYASLCTACALFCRAKMHKLIPANNVWFRQFEASDAAITYEDACSCLESMVVDAAPAYQHQPAADEELLDDAADEPGNKVNGQLLVAAAAAHDDSGQQQLVYIGDEAGDQDGAAPLADGYGYRNSNHAEDGYKDVVGPSKTASETAASRAHGRSMEQALANTTHGTAGVVIIPYGVRLSAMLQLRSTSPLHVRYA
jgi:hypothetical protein